jgi:hypothetical protein
VGGGVVMSAGTFLRGREKWRRVCSMAALGGMRTFRSGAKFENLAARGGSHDCSIIMSCRIQAVRHGSPRCRGSASQITINPCDRRCGPSARYIAEAPRFASAAEAEALKAALWPSFSGIPGGTETQGCLCGEKTETLGGGKAGSANTPTGMPIRSGSASTSQNIVDPQFGQKAKSTKHPVSPGRRNRVSAPVTVTASRGK